MGQINDLGDRITDAMERKGFHTPNGISPEKCVTCGISEADVMLGKLMLVVTEVAEAAEAIRHQDQANFNEEIADTIIRLLHISRTCKIDIEGEIERKGAANEKRPVLHGKATSI